MKEIKAIIEKFQHLASEVDVALATVVQVQGASYRRAGARMLITNDGHWIGGVSGGCLEGDLLRRAKHLMRKKETDVIRYDTSEDDNHQIGVGLGCQGVIDIFVNPIDKKQTTHPLQLLDAHQNDRTPNVFVTVVESPNNYGLAAGQMLHHQSLKPLEQCLPEALLLPFRQGIKNAFNHQKSSLQHYPTEPGTWRLFIEYLPPPIHLVMVGSNYDIYPMNDLAKTLGWKTTVIAKWTKLRKSIFSDADKVLAFEQLASLKLDARTAIVLMAHDLKQDYNALQTFVSSEASYIGLLGPKKRGNKLLQMLETGGTALSKAQVAKVFTPTGLDIGGKTPEEIALSILAEIQAVFSKRKGSFLRLRKGAIYD